ncbi:MAG TPA: hypothetical protein VH141_04025 [Pseudonocardia sp.]|nr:hypothetical protein [Pseudonocardia sp.]
MSELVQRLAEDLAERLGRSVEVDDRALRPLGITAQLGAIDQVRIDAVLRRRSGPEMVTHVESFAPPSAPSCYRSGWRRTASTP